LTVKLGQWVILEFHSLASLKGGEGRGEEAV